MAPIPSIPSGGYLYQFYPEAVFKAESAHHQRQCPRDQNLSLVGFYTLGWANSDGGAGTNASNAYNLSQDYGPATFVSRNQVFAMASYSGPWGLRFNPFLIAQSGKPFNITLPIGSSEQLLQSAADLRDGEHAPGRPGVDPLRSSG